MHLPDLASFATPFALVFFRIAGLMAFAPVIGSARVPKRVKVMLASVLTLAMAGSMPEPVNLPTDPWLVALGIGGELAFGLLLGMVLSLVFVAAQFAGGIAGQQMGFNLGGSVDPQTDFGSSPLGDVYFILTMMTFLLMDGHHAMMLGVRSSFDHLPLMSVGVSAELLEVLVGMLMSATTLAVRVAAPITVAMLVVDLALGMIGKTIPQMNLMSVGLSLRSLAGLAIVIFGIGLTGTVLADALNDAMALADAAWTQRAD